MTKKREPRPIVFVCIGMDKKNGDFISKVIPAPSQIEAGTLFFEQTNISARTIHGPFRPKKAQILENTRTLKFSDQKQFKTTYQEWVVNALPLKEPENHAYLLFIRRLDGKKQTPPKGTIVVPLTELRIQQDEKIND